MEAHSIQTQADCHKKKRLIESTLVVFISSAQAFKPQVWFRGVSSVGRAQQWHC